MKSYRTYNSKLKTWDLFILPIISVRKTLFHYSLFLAWGIWTLEFSRERFKTEGGAT